MSGAGTAGRRPRAGDVAGAVLLAGGSVAESALWRTSAALRELPLLTAPLVAVAGILLVSTLLRRAVPTWAPLGPATAMAWLAVAQPAEAAPFMFATAAGVAVLAYLAGDATGRAATPAGFGVLAAGAAVWSLLAGSADAALFAPIVLTIFGGLPWLLGRYRSQQRALVRAGTERIAQLEREQHIVAEQARLRERTDLAEEMHDSLGHELSLIALRAGALELAPDLPEGQRAAAAELRAAAGATTARLAEIVSVLRDGPPPEHPAGEPVATLVERVRASGMEVALTATGTPPPAAARTVHRVVQEALTNAAKHAPAAPVHVGVDSGEAETTVRVANPLPPECSAAGAGHGLAALRERVRLLGGELQAGADGGQFRLSARLPHRPAAGETAAGETATGGTS